MSDPNHFNERPEERHEHRIEARSSGSGSGWFIAGIVAVLAILGIVFYAGSGTQNGERMAADPATQTDQGTTSAVPADDGMTTTAPRENTETQAQPSNDGSSMDDASTAPANTERNSGQEPAPAE